MAHVIRHTFTLWVDVPVDPELAPDEITRMVIRALRKLELDSEVAHVNAVAVEDTE
jgi:hypothetical protein